MTGGPDPAQTQASRVLLLPPEEVAPHPGLLVEGVVGALGLARQLLAVGQDHVLCVLNIRNAPPAGQLGGRVQVEGPSVRGRHCGCLALGAVDVVEEMLAQLRLRVGELTQLRCSGGLGEIQVQITGFAEGGCLLLGLVVVLLRLMQLVDVVGVGGIRQVGQVLLHGVQIPGTNSPL